VTAQDVLAAFDADVQRADVAPRAPWACKDTDDQKFIDLAVAHRAILVSKDKAVLCMRKRLLAQDTQAVTAIVLEAGALTPQAA
jgi:predicted nucleic acid-binding protein